MQASLTLNVAKARQNDVYSYPILPGQKSLPLNEILANTKAILESHKW